MSIPLLCSIMQKVCVYVLYVWMLFIQIEMCPVSQYEIISYTNWFLAVGVSESLIALLSFFLSFILSPSLQTISDVTFSLCHPFICPLFSFCLFALIAISHTLFFPTSPLLISKMKNMNNGDTDVC